MSGPFLSVTWEAYIMRGRGRITCTKAGITDTKAVTIRIKINKSLRQIPPTADGLPRQEIQPQEAQVFISTGLIGLRKEWNSRSTTISITFTILTMVPHLITVQRTDRTRMQLCK